MEYLVLYNHEPIGTIVEPRADVSMGVVFGVFLPLPAYEHVRPVFRLFSAAVIGGRRTNEDLLHAYYQQRDALNLAITTRGGIPVRTQAIHIDDRSDEVADDQYGAEFIVDYEDGSFFVNTSLWDS